jgi:hypothetical protein
VPPRKKVKKKIEVLLDSDALVYSAGFAAQHTFRVLADETLESVLGPFKSAEEVKACLALPANEGTTYLQYERIEVEPLENALHTVKLQINRLLERVKEKTGLEPELRAFLTGTGNFREIIATIRPYKGNRPPWHKPRLYREIRQYLIDQWGAQVIHGQEADDEVCIRQTTAEAEKRPSIIVGIDKDLWQCPGWHYCTSKDAFARISPALGLRLFYRQVLSGDATDNVAGVYKIGGKKAKDLIQPGMTEPEMYAACHQAYAASLDKYGAEKCGYSDAVAALAENAELVWMRRAYGVGYQAAYAERNQ